VEVDAIRHKGTIHDFALLNGLRRMPPTEPAINQVAYGLRQHLAGRARADSALTGPRMCCPEA
jgi:hypothetical protein